MRSAGRTILFLFMIAAVIEPALAIDHERFIDNRGKEQGVLTHPAFDGREGGETFETAFIIPGLPFSDQGATCDNLDDYDFACPWPSASPDVVYKYTAPEAQMVTIDLCGSHYDTKVFVYEWPDLYQAIACNDDAGCGETGFQSRIEAVALQAGGEYYVVIDGYNGDCGEYSLAMSISPECLVECPPGAQEEGEPPCVDQYYDSYNGGC